MNNLHIYWSCNSVFGFPLYDYACARGSLLSRIAIKIFKTIRFKIHRVRIDPDLAGPDYLVSMTRTMCQNDQEMAPNDAEYELKPFFFYPT